MPVVFSTQVQLFPDHSFLFTKDSAPAPPVQDLPSLALSLEEGLTTLEEQLSELAATFAEVAPATQETEQRLLQTLSQLTSACTQFNMIYQQDLRHWIPDKFTPISGKSSFSFLSLSRPKTHFSPNSPWSG